MSRCLSCPENAAALLLGASNLTQCLCKPGFYNAGSEALVQCRPCTNKDWATGVCLLPMATLNEGVRVPLLVLAVLFLALDLVLVGLVLYYRQHPVIKASSPPFCLVILAGAALGMIQVFLMYPYPSTESMCATLPFTGYLAFSLLYGGLFAKTYRTGKIFNQTKIAKVSFSPSVVVQEAFRSPP